jgi:non-ribosomal peptide synthetase component E (peptide arylation enzyme)
MPARNVTPALKTQYRREGFWSDQTLFELMARHARTSPGKLAIADASRRWSYQDFLTRVTRLSDYLLSIGVGRGDLVALQSPSRAEIPLVHFACNRIGALLLPLHEAWREVEVGHLLSVSQAKAFITVGTYRDFDHYVMAKSLQAATPSLKHLIVSGASVPSAAMSLEELIAAPAARAPSADELARNRPDPDDPGLVMVSSGTTALPKASVWSGNDLYAFLVVQYAQRIKLTKDDIAVQIAPASMGSTGYVFPVLAPLLTGGTSIMIERYEPDEALEVIQREGATLATAVPAQIVRMADSPKARSGDYTRFTRFNNAGAPLPYDAGLAIERLLDCRTQVSYGSTDGGVPSMISIDDPQEKRLRTVGRRLPGQELALFDNDYRPVPPGATGEVSWRGPNKTRGYLNDPARTAEAFRDDGWYLSGDLGVIDEDGYLRIVGRKKDMILRGGHNISPALIEDLLARHPKVLEVAVAAMPDRVLGERACAFVVLKPGASPLTLPEAVDFLKAQKMTVLDLPERVEVMDALPMSAGGKVQKAELTKLVTERLKREGKA